MAGELTHRPPAGGAAAHVVVLINTCFEHRTRTAAELRSCLGPARCAALAAELPAVCERLAIMLARLAAAGDGSVVLLPSSEIMDATHAPWIRRIAGWCERWPAVPTPAVVAAPELAEGGGPRGARGGRGAPHRAKAVADVELIPRWFEGQEAARRQAAAEVVAAGEAEAARLQTEWANAEAAEWLVDVDIGADHTTLIT
jgi:hypothetical protein